jgi:hypothetical protein
MNLSAEVIAGIALAVVPITEWLKWQLGLTGFKAQATSWLVACALALLVGPLDLKQVLASGLLAGLVANGVYTLEQVRALLALMGLRRT